MAHAESTPSKPPPVEKRQQKSQQRPSNPFQDLKAFEAERRKIFRQEMVVKGSKVRKNRELESVERRKAIEAMKKVRGGRA